MPPNPQKPRPPKVAYDAALSEALHEANDGLLLSSEEGVVVYANAPALRLLGGDVVGKQLSAIAEGHLIVDSRPQIRQHAGDLDDMWSTQLFGERHIEVRSRLVDKNGVRCTLTSLRDATSRILTERSLRARIAFENLVVSNRSHLHLADAGRGR